MELPAGSIEYVHVPLSGPDGVDLEGVDVSIAFVPQNSRPGAGDWVAAEFSDGTARRLTEAVAEPTRLDVWVRISDFPEVVVRKAGRLVFT